MLRPHFTRDKLSLTIGLKFNIVSILIGRTVFRFLKPALPIAGFGIVIIMASFVFVADATAQLKEKTGGKEKEKSPIVITSNKLFADNVKNIQTFEGNVVAKSGEMIIYSDKMIVYHIEKGEDRDKDKEGDIGGDIDRIEAYGNVKVIKGDRTIISDEAIYYESEEKMVFKGNPKAWRGDDVVTGSMITYFTGEDRSIVENSKVILMRKERSGGKSDRTKATEKKIPQRR
ncbi:MAG: LptA/OstA family protein [Nitrospirota bacterium]